MATDINITVPLSRPVQTQANNRVAPETVTRDAVNATQQAQATPAPKAAEIKRPDAQPDVQEAAKKSAEKIEEAQERLEQAVTSINEYTQNIQRLLQFSISESDGRTIIKVIDSETNKIIRMIPPDETLRIAQNLASLTGNGGLLFQAKA
jgi:flagellar protein FlaG